MTAAFAPGFADAGTAAQVVFRVVMEAMARPGAVLPLATMLRPPAPLGAGAAAVVLALADYETPVWLGNSLSPSREVADWLRFHTGAPMTSDPLQAAFALVPDAAALPPFEAFARGSPEYPDRSTTLVIDVDGFDGPHPLTLSGPGIAGTCSFAPASLPADFVARWNANRALFPCGVDLLFVSAGGVAALPRSTRIVGVG